MATACTLVDRIHERYFDDDDVQCDLIISSSPSKNFHRGLEIVVLNHMQIRDVGDTQKLSEYTQHVVDLDLAWNAIEDWGQIAQMCSRLPVLRLLNLSFNPLAKTFDIDLPIMKQLRTLILNGTHLPLATVAKVVAACPNLHELHLSHNNFHLDDPSTSDGPVSTSVQIVHFNRSSLRDWEHVMRIMSKFPNKRTVFLSENPISKITVGPAHVDFKEHTTLQQIALNKTELSDWESLDALDGFPNLKEVRLNNTPLLENYSDEEKMHIVTARLTKLKILNGSLITDEQREDSERFFIRYYQDREDKPSHYQRLVEKHGTLERLAKVDLTPHTHVKVRLVCEECEHDAEDTVDVNQTVVQFMRHLEKKLGIPYSRIRLFHQYSNGDFPMEIRFPNQHMHALNIEDGDVLTVVSKILPSRKRAPTKSETSADR